MNKLGLAAMLTMWPLVALSAEPLAPAGNGFGVGVSVRFGKTDSSFKYDDGRRSDNTFQWIGVSWREEIAPRLRLGLETAGASVSQTGNTTTAGLELDGYYVGASLRAALYDTTTVQLYSHASYTYTRLAHKEDDDSVVLSWYQPLLELGIAFRPADRLRLFAGAGWSAIDGQERVRGTISQTVDFEGEHRGVAFAGIDFAVDRDGFVGIEARTGETRGGELYFKKNF